MPLLPTLGVIFITLRLCEVITWSWLWVLAPFWGGAALFLVFILMAALGCGIAGIGASMYERRGRRAR